jgi:hypothetical protein
MAHTLDTSRLKEVFDDVEANTDRLTEWERQFLESVSDQFTQRGSLSEKQLEVLERIYLKLP